MFKKKNTEFSKTLLKQESALIWILSISFVLLAFYCIHMGFVGSLPWLSAMVGFPWTAYGVSQAMYYRKSMKENTAGGIKFESVMEEARKITAHYQNAAGNFGYQEDTAISTEGEYDPYANAADITYSENIDDYQI